MESLTRRSLLAGGTGLLAGALGACTSLAPDDSGVVSRGSSSTTAAPPVPKPTSRPPPPPGPLPGIGTWVGAERGTEVLAESGARWFYTWAPDHPWITAPEGSEFVPMIQDTAHLTDEALELAKRNGDTLLGFNEPELAIQANLSVSAALDAWPRLEETGMRLGAPALAGAADNPESWFGKFMRGIETRDHRVDFVPVHWYLAPELREEFSIERCVDDLHGYINRVHDAYGLPIWVTEFSLITWYPTTSLAKPPGDQAAFLAASAEMMTSLSFVERWAWFSLTPPKYAPAVAAFDRDSQITPVGRQFQSLT